jgi:hypothetical protein
MLKSLRDAAVGPVLMALTLMGCARDYVATENLVYDMSHAFGEFDYYEPKGDTRTERPAILAIHGMGDDNVYYPQAERLTAARRAIHEFLDSRLRHDGTAYLESTHVKSPPGNVR